MDRPVIEATDAALDAFAAVVRATVLAFAFWQHSWCSDEVAGNGGESLEVSQNQNLYVSIMKIMIYQIIYIYTLYLRCTHTYIVSTYSHIQVFSRQDTNFTNCVIEVRPP